MQYRILPHGGERISEIGLGMGSIHHSGEAEIVETIDRAIEAGVNYFDGVPSEYGPYKAYGKAFAGRRDQILIQMHFGALYETGPNRAYGWTQDLDRIKRQFDEELGDLRTDYADFGFVHCIDEPADFDHALESGLWDYLLELRRTGVIHHIGGSTHNVEIGRRLLATGEVDMIMFSINPSYDYSEGSYSIGDPSERRAFYRECESEGVGLSVMKPFAGGQLLDAKLSPFKRALTHTQLISYALGRPGVLTVLPGVRGPRDLDVILAYESSSASQRDYSSIGKSGSFDIEGTCVYCNHCQPCPAGIDVGLVNKYYDLSLVGDVLARDHYAKLLKHASDCLECGHCESRCPFHVGQETRMREISAYFGS